MQGVGKATRGLGHRGNPGGVVGLVFSSAEPKMDRWDEERPGIRVYHSSEGFGEVLRNGETFVASWNTLVFTKIQLRRRSPQSINIPLSSLFTSLQTFS